MKDTDRNFHLNLTKQQSAAILEILYWDDLTNGGHSHLRGSNPDVDLSNLLTIPMSEIAVKLEDDDNPVDFLDYAKSDSLSASDASEVAMLIIDACWTYLDEIEDDWQTKTTYWLQETFNNIKLDWKVSISNAFPWVLDLEKAQSF